MKLLGAKRRLKGKPPQLTYGRFVLRPVCATKRIFVQTYLFLERIKIKNEGLFQLAYVGININFSPRRGHWKIPTPLTLCAAQRPAATQGKKKSYVQNYVKNGLPKTHYFYWQHVYHSK